MSDLSDDKTLDTCGCCEIDPLRYPAHHNPPGQDAISYRLATHSQFLQRMRAMLARDQLLGEAGVTDRRPLARLTTRASDDPTVALLDAWATTADVLTFYQERIANEAYLRTAGERRSVLELARAISYELKPGVAASTVLAFTVDRSPGSPKDVALAKGVRVLSIPGQDQLPQTFETIEDFVARADWNALAPYLGTHAVADSLALDTVSLRLSGVSTGLQAGDAVAVVDPDRDSDPDQDRWSVRNIKSVVASVAQGHTTITWEPGLDHDFTDPARPPAVYALRLRAAAFGHNAADWATLPADIKNDYVDRALGALTPVAVSADGTRVVAGGDDGSLKLWTYSDASGWVPETVPVSFGISAVTAVAVSEAVDRILLGRPDGALVLLSKAALGVWSEAPVPATGRAHAGTITAAAFTAAADKALSRDDQGVSFVWTVANRTAENSYVSQLVAGSGNYRVSSEGAALKFWRKSGSAWTTETISGAAHAGTITAITLTVDGSIAYIVSGGADGVVKRWHRDLASATSAWQAIALPGAGTAHTGPVLRVAITAVGDRVLSRGADGLARVWAVSGTALLYSFVEDTVDYLTDWPDFALDRVGDAAAELFLDNVYTTVVPGSWLALVEGDRRALYRVVTTDVAWHTQFNLSAKVTRLTLDTESGLADFDRRDVVVYVRSEALKLFEQQVPEDLPIEGDVLELSVLVPNLTAERTVVVTGKRMRARITDLAPQRGDDDEPGDPLVERLVLRSADGFLTVDLYRGDLLEVVRRPVAVPVGTVSWHKQDDGFAGTVTTGTGIEWLLRDRNGVEGLVYWVREEAADQWLEDAAIDVGFIALEHPDEKHDSVSEVAVIKRVDESPDRQRTVITLWTALENIYDHDPETFGVNANVADATHGETIPDEVLGSGDGSLINQIFDLDNIPLTYVTAATASGAASTLEVRVNDVLWEQVDSLYNSGPRSQHYMVRQDNEGHTFVQFGDGIRGARLPSGQENVRARYRKGIGLDGEVPAYSLKLLQVKPLGIKEVTNPLAAAGAAGPEDLDQARANAPRTVLTLDRVVSIQDYQDFAAAFAGIGKAQAASLWNGEAQLVHLTIGSASGATIASNAPLRANLVAALDRLRDVSVQVLVDGYTEVRFRIAAQLVVDARYLREQVEAEVQATLRAAFGFNNRRFGQAVTEAEVLAEMHQVDGVVAAKLTLLAVWPADEAPASTTHPLRLDAARAVWDRAGRRAIPAELLLLDPAAEAIVLEKMPT